MDKAAVLIDGGYIDAINRDHFGRQKIDLLSFSSILCEPDCTRFRTYYYNCPPYQGNPPTEYQKSRKAGYDRYINKLRSLPRFIIREGILRLISEEPFEVEQKGIDVLFACDLVRLSASRAIQEAIIVAGDADYVPAVEIAREEHVIAKLVYYPGSCAPALYDACDERVRITRELIESCLRED
jgi:uncharacterized LabA/DUF88 family protein